MKIVPIFNGQPIRTADLEVVIDPEDRNRARLLVQHTSTVMNVYDQDSFIVARRAAAELKALVDEIEADRKRSKGAFDLVGRSIQDLAHEVSQPVKAEQARILGLLEGYVEKLEVARIEQERLVAQEKRRAQEEADHKIREAEAARDRAQRELQTAQNEIEHAARREEAQARESYLLQQQLQRELALEVIAEQEPQRGLVPDGRVNHVYDFELQNVQTTTKAGCWRLLKWTLDIRACQDSVKGQLELAPNIEPSLPGIKITKRISVSVKAASRIK